MTASQSQTQSQSGNNDDNDDNDYDPTYKIAEFKEYLDMKFQRLFVPSQQLSLDETWKGKVRIRTKATQYRIKMYVLTDRATSYVSRVMIDTDNYNYNRLGDESITMMKKTKKKKKKKLVEVVKSLCQPYANTHRTIYMDRRHTSMDLLKELQTMNLYVTGICNKNLIPADIRIARTSQDFKSMARGDHKRHRLQYHVNNDERFAGLVCWRDHQDLVYCLTNDTNTRDRDRCQRETEGGLIEISRPIVISKYHGSVEGANGTDIRRLSHRNNKKKSKDHNNSTIMGPIRWWLKLFFHLLDVGTSNALVLYNESLKEAGRPIHEKMTLVDFKLKLIEGFVGTKITSVVPVPRNVEHVPERRNSRNRCAYCALFLARQTRTRFWCAACNVPLCSVGSGHVDQDCFTLCHQSDMMKNLVIKKYAAMKKTANHKLIRYAIE